MVLSLGNPFIRIVSLDEPERFSYTRINTNRVQLQFSLGAAIGSFFRLNIQGNYNGDVDEAILADMMYNSLHYRINGGALTAVSITNKSRRGDTVFINFVISYANVGYQGQNFQKEKITFAFYVNDLTGIFYHYQIPDGFYEIGKTDTYERFVSNFDVLNQKFLANYALLTHSPKTIFGLQINSSSTQNYIPITLISQKTKSKADIYRKNNSEYVTVSASYEIEATFETDYADLIFHQALSTAVLAGVTIDGKKYFSDSGDYELIPLDDFDARFLQKAKFKLLLQTSNAIYP